MIVDYTDYRSFTEKYRQSFANVRAMIERYNSKLQDYCGTAVMSGQLHDELVIFREHSMKLPGFIDEAIEKMDDLVENYLDDMNSAQCLGGEYILYRKDYAGPRDFTDAFFEKIKYLCDSSYSDANYLTKINDWGEDIVHGVAAWLGKTFGWFNARQMQRVMMESNDVTEARLLDIQNRLKETELSYQGIAQNLADCLVDTEDYVMILAEAMAMPVSEFSMEGFAPRLSKLYDEMQEKLKELDFGMVTEADILAFVNSKMAKYFFKIGASIIYEFMEGLGQITWKDKEFWELWITQMFDLSKFKIIHGLMGDYTYEDYMRYQEIMGIIEDVTDTKTFDDGTEKQSLDNARYYLKLVELYGKDWENYLEGKRMSNGKLIQDKRTIEYKLFKEFFDSVDNAEKILKYGTDLCEIVAYLSADYTHNMQVVESMKASGNLSEQLLKDLEWVEMKYSQSSDMVVAYVGEKLVEYGGEHVLEWGEKYLKKEKIIDVGALTVVGWIEKGINIGGEITGTSDAAKARMELMLSGYEMMRGAETAYTDALTALQSCTPGSENYQDCLTNFKNCFELYKVTQKRTFDKMAIISEGRQKDYYLYCAEELDRLDLDNYENFNLVSFEEYQNGQR